MPAHVEIWDVDHYVLAVDQCDLTRWTSHGYALVDASQVMFAVDAALARAEPEQQLVLWTALHGPGLPEYGSPYSLQDELRDAAMRPAARLRVLVRKLRHGVAGEPFKRKEPETPPRLDTEHYIVVQAVDPNEKPVAGVQLELVIADGELKGTVTDKDGYARVERIHAGSVVIRVLNVDGGMWTPLEGAASKPSSADDRVRWHSVVQGECLSKIAHLYNLEGWQKLWEHPKNAELRRNRKSPHVLYPGDLVAVPGIEVREIVRDTDATHRLQVKAASRLWVRLNLLDRQHRPVEQGRYRILIQGELHAEGSIENGKVACEVPVLASDVVLVAQVGDETVRRALQISALDPCPAISGLQARLSNLDHYAGEVDGVDSETLAFAVREFREVAGLGHGGERDDALLGALEREHRV